MRLSALAWGCLFLALLGLFLAPATPAGAYPERILWDREFLAPGAGDIVLADLTGDGWTDLAAADDRGTVWLYIGSELGLPLEATLGLPASGVVDLAVGDLDGDGRSDLLIADGQKTFWFLPDEQWASAPGVPAPGAHRVAVGDLNGDDRTDLAVLGTAGVSVWMSLPGTGGYASEPSHVLSDNAAFHDLSIGDLDGDGRDDLAIAKPYEVHVYFQEALGLDLEPKPFSTFPTSGEAALSIVPTGGVVPLLAVASAGDAYASGAIGLWRFDGEKFRLDASFGGAYSARFAVGDVNDDRRADLVVARLDGSLAVFLQRSGYFGGTAPDWVLGGVPGTTDAHLAVGDANGDSFADLLLRTPGTFVLYVQEDAMPRLIRALPRYVVNRGAIAKGLVDLREFFADDHNRLTFAVVYASDPANLTATLDGSRLDFEAADWYGEAEFRVSAWDGNPNHVPVESNRFTVVVNDVPRITSEPVRRAVAGDAYSYLVTTADAFPVGDRPTFELLRGPEGMAIDNTTGLLTWTPQDAQVGSHEIAILVRDGNGGATLQQFTVVVSAPGAGSPAVIMAVGVAATSAAFLAAAALINENAKYLFLLFVLPLYTKIKRERVLDHFVRGQIFGYIQANPGEHYNAIKDALGLTNGSLAHHLRTLEREQFIKSKRFGLYRRFYPMNFRLPPDDAFQPKEIQQTILAVIGERPGITQKEIAGRLGLTPPTVNYHIGVLSDRNLIRVERRGRSTHATLIEGGST